MHFYIPDFLVTENHRRILDEIQKRLYQFGISAAYLHGSLFVSSKEVKLFVEKENIRIHKYCDMNICDHFEQVEVSYSDPNFFERIVQTVIHKKHSCSGSKAKIRNTPGEYKGKLIL